MKNNLKDLNNHLFLQLERINDESLKGKRLEKELKRSQAVSSLAKNIVSNATVVLKAERMKECGELRDIPAMIENKPAMIENKSAT